MSKRRQINLRKETYDDLDEIRGKGQSFDGIVQELLDKQKVEVQT